MRYFSNTIVFAAATSAIAMIACKPSSLSKTTEVKAAATFDSPLANNLPKLSIKTIEKFFSVVRDFQITDIYNDNYRFTIPWGSISENCNLRAATVDYLIARLAEKTDIAAWDKHIASVVNLDGELVVLDLSVSQRKPIAVKDWIRSVAHKDADCPEVKRDEFSKRNSYWLMRWQFDSDFPAKKQLCGFTFNGSFAVAPDSSSKQEDLTRAFDGIRGLLKTNYASIPGQAFINITPAELAYSGVIITCRFEEGRNFGEEALCKAMNHGFRFCKKYN
ncbi:hypothetical protein EBR21_05425 [bacterium]|nr:hypothetical protein [bacterium]